MVAVAMLLIWGGYGASLWGWCLFRDYDLTFGQLMSPLHPYGSGKGQGWPPAKLDPSVIWPGQTPAAGGSGSSGGGGGKLPPNISPNPAVPYIPAVPAPPPNISPNPGVPYIPGIF